MNLILITILLVFSVSAVDVPSIPTSPEGFKVTLPWNLNLTNLNIDAYWDPTCPDTLNS